MTLYVGYGYYRVCGVHDSDKKFVFFCDLFNLFLFYQYLSFKLKKGQAYAAQADKENKGMPQHHCTSYIISLTDNIGADNYYPNNYKQQTIR